MIEKYTLPSDKYRFPKKGDVVLTKDNRLGILDHPSWCLQGYWYLETEEGVDTFVDGKNPVHESELHLIGRF